MLYASFAAQDPETEEGRCEKRKSRPSVRNALPDERRHVRQPFAFVLGRQDDGVFVEAADEPYE
jgi:hypothetical protein